MIESYYKLIKPGVMYGNLITTIAGFLFASQGSVDLELFLATTIGTAMVISSACVINNYLDQDIDSVMERTKNRPLVSGEVGPNGALTFGITLFVLGFSILSLFTNWQVVLIGFIGFVTYVWLYGASSKRKSVHGTLVGSISGATPITAGYIGATGQADPTALILFLILFIWQMPEFYSISIFRLSEYKKANIPVISVVRGVDHTKKMILIYTVLFVLSSLSLALTHTVSWTYFITMLALGMNWIVLGVSGLYDTDSITWSRKMFRFSLIILVVFSALISIDHYLP